MKKDQVFNILKSRIIRGEYPSGHKLPGEPELAASLGVSRITLRAALQMLRDNGMISIRNRSGSYVLERSGSKKYLVVVAGEDIDNISQGVTHKSSEPHTSWSSWHLLARGNSKLPTNNRRKR